MLAAGIPDSKLIFFPLTPHPRYVRRSGPREPGGFRVVYVGGVTVQKGIPLLIEAFAKLPDRDAQLTLVGGTSSRGMRRYMDDAIRRDPRIRIAPGDPLPHLWRADVLVHPTWEDGF